MTREEIVNEMGTLDAEIANIKAQLDAHQARHVELGEPLKHVWAAKARAAMRYKKLEWLALDRELSELKRKSFMALAHKTLPPETFQAILSQVSA